MFVSETRLLPMSAIKTPSVRHAVLVHGQIERDRFARTLTNIRIEKGWNQSDVAREAMKFVPRDNHGRPLFQIGRDSISKYAKGKVLPRPEHLEPIARALGVERALLLSGRHPSSPPAAPAADPDVPPAIRVTSQPDGRVLLQINKPVDMDTATKILGLLKEVKDE
jgi:transcriptional regulator with XRE-family HTH domain